jgi:hypothetical protein
VSFTLNPDTITVSGPAGVGTGPEFSFEVELDAPAPADGVQVDITSGGQEFVSLLVREGQTAASQAITLSDQTPPGDYPFEARLGEVLETAMLHVVSGA